MSCCWCSGWPFRWRARSPACRGWRTLSWVPFFAVIFRMFSRNISARRRENQRFVGFFTRLRDRDNRYFSCPKCRQMVRVPKGKGKINSPLPQSAAKSLSKKHNATPSTNAPPDTVRRGVGGFLQAKRGSPEEDCRVWYNFVTVSIQF